MRQKKRNRLGLSLFVVLFIALTSLCIFITSEYAGAVEGGENYAILIGVNDYFRPTIPPLKCAVNDAKTMKKTFIDVSGFKEENIIILTTDQSPESPLMPTKQNIEEALMTLAGKVGPRDNFYFFFSGHGISMEEKSYLVTFNTRPVNAASMHFTSFSVESLRQGLDLMNVARVFVFIDACRNDPRTDSVRIAQNTTDNEGKGFDNNTLNDTFSKNLTIMPPKNAASGSNSFAATFFSCDVGQQSFEWRENKLGYFTYFLSKGLEGEGINKNGDLTVNSLADFLRLNVSKAVKENRKENQSPKVTIKGTDAAKDWVIHDHEFFPKVKGKSKSSSRSPQVCFSQFEPQHGLPSCGSSSSRSSSTIITAEDSSPTPSPEMESPEKKSKVTYNIGIYTSIVEGRSYDQLTRSIVENRYEIDKDYVKKGMIELLNSHTDLEYTANPEQADVWIYFNVCPLDNMNVDLLVRDRRQGGFIYRNSSNFYRPFPGKNKQLADKALKVMKNDFLKPMMKEVEKAPLGDEKLKYISCSPADIIFNTIESGYKK